MEFAHAIAVGGNAVHLAQSCADQLAGAKGQLGFVYVTEALAKDTTTIIERLRASLSVLHWSGAVGLGICATGVEYYEEPACTVLICDVDTEGFRVFSGVSSDGVVSPQDCQSWLADQQQKLAIVHANPYAEGLADRIGALATASGAYLVGGLTGGKNTLSQIADTPVDANMSGVFFGDGISVATNLTQGCSPIGELHDITVGDEDLLMELDGLPALEVLRRELGDQFSGDWQSIAGAVHAGLPVKGSDTGDYLVRPLIGIDPNRGWLQIGDRVKTGDRLVFVRRDATTALVDLERMLDRLAERCDGRPKAGLYHSCIARGRNQFGPGAEELATIRDRLGDFPLVGMFGNGEISYDRIYSYTGVLTVFV